MELSVAIFESFVSITIVLKKIPNSIKNTQTEAEGTLISNNMDFIIL
jgi:hypothetical protein